MRITVAATDDKQGTELARLLRERSGADEVSLTASSLDKLLANADAQAIDVLVLARESLDPLDADRLERLGYAMPATAVILVSSEHTPQQLMLAMRAGVKEVVPAPPEAATLYPALRRIAD